MSITKSKYLNITDEHYPINGNMIKYYLTSNNINKTQVAKKMGILPTTLFHYFRQDSLQLGILWKLSKVLNHNFLIQMGEYLQIPFETQAEKKLKQTVAEKEVLIQQMEMKITIYEKMLMK